MKIEGHRFVTWVAALTMLVAASAAVMAQSKYGRYTKLGPRALFILCVTKNDDTACFFYAGLMKKRGKIRAAHDAYYMGAQFAKSRAGFICMLQLAQMYEKGDGARKDPVQAYRWYTVLMSNQPRQDLRSKASAKRQELAVNMSTDQIAIAEAMARAW
jgi:hypothetical protein